MKHDQQQGQVSTETGLTGNDSTSENLHILKSALEKWGVWDDAPRNKKQETS